MDDRSLRSRLRAGDPSAFDALYERFRPGLFRYLTRLCQNIAIAEELSQEVWMRFAGHARNLPDDVELAPWLFTVARNLFLSQRRRQLLARRWHFELGRRFVASPPESPFEALAGSQAERDLERALAALPDSHREILLLIAVEQLTPSEAAQVLNVRPDAARQRLARARELLEQTLERMQRPIAVGDST